MNHILDVPQSATYYLSVHWVLGGTDSEWALKQNESYRKKRIECLSQEINQDECVINLG